MEAQDFDMFSQSRGIPCVGRFKQIFRSFCVEISGTLKWLAINAVFEKHWSERRIELKTGILHRTF